MNWWEDTPESRRMLAEEQAKVAAAEAKARTFRAAWLAIAREMFVEPFVRLARRRP